MKAAELDASLVDAAANWFVRLSSGVVSADEYAAFERWRAASTDHACAWERFETMQQTMRAGTGHLPVALVSSTLRTTRSELLERRRLLKGLAAIGALLPVAYVVRQSSPVQHALADLRTGVGERSTLTLSDGTQLWLNTNSAVDVQFSERERRLWLRDGEIQIATATDAAGRPFVVVTTDGSLQPVGTRFTVRRYNDESMTRLDVSEGAVDVRPNGSSEMQRVIAGQGVRFDSRHISSPLPLGNDSGAWTDGMLGAERMRLADFVAELSRHRRGLLRCDPAVADLRLTGTFPLEDTDRVLAKVAETLPVKVHYRTRYWVTLAPR